MNKIVYLLIFSILISFKVNAQDYSLKLGEISDAEWQLDSYDKDPEAGAVVLFDIGKSFFVTKKNGDIVVKFQRKKRIKILKESEFDQAEISIPFYVADKRQFEKVTDIKAITYSKNGDEILSNQLQQASVFEEKIDKNWHVSKFTFPDAQVGSILEYTYTLETPFLLKLPDWEFQSNIPTLFSEYKVSMVPFYEYVFITQGIDSFDIQTVEEDTMWKKFGQIKSASGQNIGDAATYREVNYSYVLKDVAAFKDELYITSTNDYIAKIDFQLSNIYDVPNYVSDQYESLGEVTIIMTSWPKMIEDFLEADYFGKYLNSSQNLAKKIINSELILDGKTKPEKARTIINYVKNNFKWDGELRKFVRLKSKEFVAQKQGNSAEINLFLTAMLRAADIEAQPVILSTRDHGKIKADYPFQHFFNNVITLVDEPGFTYLTDATDPLIAYNRIPPRCINENGLIVREWDQGWVNLESKFLSLDNKLFTVSIDPETLVVKTGVTIQASEYHAYSYKSAYGKSEENVRKGMLENGLENVSDVRFINYEKNSKPYVIAFKASAEVEELGGKLILAPFFEFPISESGLTKNERKYPIDLIFADSRSFKSQINIPEGYKIDKLPEGIDLKDQLTSVKLKYTISGNQLIVEGSYSFKKAVFQPNEYAKVKSLLDQVAEKFNQEIIFEPI